MIVAKLLYVKVQPVFVFVDTDTADVTPAPSVAPADVPSAQLGQLVDMIDDARQQLDKQIGTQSPAPETPSTSACPDASLSPLR